MEGKVHTLTTVLFANGKNWKVTLSALEGVSLVKHHSQRSDNHVKKHHLIAAVFSTF